ncbi:MAG TPA: HAMP domain-containing sensor histidine kinase [Ktedonobacteraceae bacterium]|nr:HAMP domain-containing sensor histidine kinase [Ktedonobacteraceae bacterium]
MSRRRIRMFRRWTPGIRIQLTLLYTAVFALLIFLFGFILYTTLQSSLSSSVDTALQLRAQQIAAGISDDSGNISIQDVTGELPGLPETVTPSERGYTTDTPQPDQTAGPNTVQKVGQSDVNIGTLVRILNTKGHSVYTSPAFRSLLIPTSSITQPLHGSVWQGTVTARNGQAVRLYSMNLNENGTIYGVLQVGESLAQLYATLQSIILALLILAPFVLLLSAGGSYWLAKRAFRPILYLTRTAREIKAGDLHRRVPVPRARDEVHDLALTLNDMIGRLDQAFTQQRRFVADASHELRTPVTVIRSVTDIALENALTLEEAIAVLRDVNAESERLGQLINDLLALARADEGQLSLDCEPVRLDLLAHDVADTMEPLALERAITLTVQATSPAIVLGDTARLIQVMMGLVDNALTYTNAGGSVTLSVEVNTGYATFAVHDTGIGIAPRDVEHIFERFYRADPARSRAAGGSGLGLSIVDWIVQAHQGTIVVESQERQGSTFTVKLPLAPGNPSQFAQSWGEQPALKQSQAAQTQSFHH